MVLENPNQLFPVLGQQQGTQSPFGQGGESLICGSKNREGTFAPQLIDQVSRFECHDQRLQISNPSDLFDEVIYFRHRRPEADRCHGQRVQPFVLEHFSSFQLSFQNKARSTATVLSRFPPTTTARHFEAGLRLDANI